MNFLPNWIRKWSGSDSGGGGDESGDAGNDLGRQQPEIDPRRRPKRRGLFCGGRARSKTPSARFQRPRWKDRAPFAAEPASSEGRAVSRTERKRFFKVGVGQFFFGLIVARLEIGFAADC